MTTFEFYRFRFRFRAAGQVRFPGGKTANLVRGAFGAALREAAPPALYARFFEPGTALGRAPSGLADWPRPFVLRPGHLDGVAVEAGGSFFFDTHVFDLGAPVLPYLRAAFARLGQNGIGPGRGRAELAGVEQLDLADVANTIDDLPLAPCALSLEPEPHPVERICARFVSPTELKIGGVLADRPEFPILFARLRDRLSTLRALYGAGPLEIDFRAMGERTGSIRLGRCRLKWEHTVRRSGRTGQVHPLGGFTGDAEYLGELAEFLPWLRAARWIGVGRQTVWGKGDMRVDQLPAPADRSHVILNP